MADRSGEYLGNYQLLRILDHGTYGEVYLGKQLYLEKYVAIKVLHSHLYLHDQAKQDFQTEAKRLSNLTHPNIVRVLDFGIASDCSYLVMEYAPNGSLRKRHPIGSHLSLDTVVSYAEQIASALQYIHEQKMIHRDVKPGNILLSANNTLLLSDVGLTIIAHTEASLSLQEALGTPSYMAPEQARGKAVPASDQYALGIMVYEWLCGELPFISTSRGGLGALRELEEQHRSVQPPPLRQKLATIPLAVEAATLKALNKNPQDRFISVQAFAEQLKQSIQPLPRESLTSPTVVNLPGLSTPSKTNDLTLNQSPVPIEVDVTISPRQSSVSMRTNAQLSRLPQPSVGHHVPHTLGAKTPLVKKPVLKMSLLIGLALFLILGSVGIFNLISSIETPSIHLKADGHTPSTAVTQSSTATAIIQNSTVRTATAVAQSSTATAIVQNSTATAVAQSSTATAVAQSSTATAVAQSSTATAVAQSMLFSSQNPYTNMVLNDTLDGSSNAHSWTINAGCHFANSSYQVTGLCIAGWTSLSNFAYQIQMSITSGQSGIIFQYNQANGDYYYFFIDDTVMQYNLVRFNGSTFIQVPITHINGSNPHINFNLGATNTMGVIATGNTFKLFVNSQFIDEGTDSTYTNGNVGVVVCCRNSSAAIYVNAKVWI